MPRAPGGTVEVRIQIPILGSGSQRNPKLFPNSEAKFEQRIGRSGDGASRRRRRAVVAHLPGHRLLHRTVVPDTRCLIRPSPSRPTETPITGARSHSPLKSWISFFFFRSIDKTDCRPARPRGLHQNADHHMFHSFQCCAATCAAFNLVSYTWLLSTA